MMQVCFSPLRIAYTAMIGVLFLYCGYTDPTLIVRCGYSEGKGKGW